MLALYTTKNSSSKSASELLMKRKLQKLVPFPNVNTKTKLKKPTAYQLVKNLTIKYKQHGLLSPE